jgi:hypothetical protein
MQCSTQEAWALKLRDNRNTSDFRTWKDHDAYHRTLERLLRDPRVETKTTRDGAGIPFRVRSNALYGKSMQ